MEKTELSEEKIKRKRIFAYAAIIFVVFVWGVSPLLTSNALGYYSATAYSFMGALISGIALLIICLPRLKELNATYFKVAIPTGLFNALANLLQKIGLPYTTPTHYAFLENLSCVAVPILLFVFIKKKPSILTITASTLCLAGCFVLSGIDFSKDGLTLGKGEILCALAGVFYGVNIAGTGVYAKKLYAPLYVMLQTWVNVFVSLFTAIVLNYTKINGEAISPFVFSWEIKALAFVGVLTLISSTFCWIVRTHAMKFVNASVVAVMMPFSAVVTGVVSVLIKTDAPSLNLFLGGGIVLIATILSAIDDVHDKKESLPKSERGFNG